MSSRNWNNRSLQAILPTYRWVFDHGKDNNLAVSINYADAYNGGNALKLRGQMTKGSTSHMALYQTAFPVTKKTKLTTTVKATVPTALDLVVTLADGSTQTIKGDKEVATDWTTITYSLKDIKGK